MEVYQNVALACFTAPMLIHKARVVSQNQATTITAHPLIPVLLFIHPNGLNMQKNHAILEVRVVTVAERMQVIVRAQPAKVN